jgi:exonuclease SbcC
MRPLRLGIKGFTAFRDEQEIDFESLESPFAIVGPTGSGKSSILDAMTYALYGQVDRVDERSTREMITQGQPSMAVDLEFEVDDERFRVTRRTPRTGATKVLVQRLVDGEWRQAGEGADRVKDANRMLQRAVGLDFDGFTRSVMLPQGKFSAFMSGDPRQRREILTDLLGLGRFLIMAQHARQIAAEASGKAGTYDEMIATRYADATPEALEAARAAASEGALRQEALATAAAGVGEVAERWKAVHDAVRELRTCAAETRSSADALAEHAARLETLIGPRPPPRSRPPRRRRLPARRSRRPSVHGGRRPTWPGWASRHGHSPPGVPTWGAGPRRLPTPQRGSRSRRSTPRPQKPCSGRRREWRKRRRPGWRPPARSSARWSTPTRSPRWWAR